MIENTREKTQNNELIPFNNRVYGILIIKSKNSNYNADFSGSPRTLLDGRVYATDKVAKFNIRKFLDKKDDSQIFVKQTTKSNLNPMTLKEVYEHHFGNIKNQNKVGVLQNLLSKIDVRLFGVTFAPTSDDAKGKNISIHGPVQISYGINRFEQLKDSGMHTDQIGSPYASEEGASQTTLGTQTRSQEAHYIHHFSINPKNIEKYIDQIFNVVLRDLENCEKEEKKNKVLDTTKVDELKKFYAFTETFGKENIKEFRAFLNNRKEEIKKSFFQKFQSLTIGDIKKLKSAMALATTDFDSTSKKDSENELLLWIELEESSEKILKNFTDLITVKTDPKNSEKNEIDLSNVFEYLNNSEGCIEKMEVYYDKEFTTVSGLENLQKDNLVAKKIFRKYENLNDVLKNNIDEQQDDEKS